MQIRNLCIGIALFFLCITTSIDATSKVKPVIGVYGDTYVAKDNSGVISGIYFSETGDNLVHVVRQCRILFKVDKSIKTVRKLKTKFWSPDFPEIPISGWISFDERNGVHSLRIFISEDIPGCAFVFDREFMASKGEPLSMGMNCPVFGLISTPLSHYYDNPNSKQRSNKYAEKNNVICAYGENEGWINVKSADKFGTTGWMASKNIQLPIKF